MNDSILAEQKASLEHFINNIIKKNYLLALKRIVLLLLLQFPSHLKAQISRQDFFVPKEDNGKTIGQVIDQKNKDYGLEFFFQDESLKNTIIQGILVKKHIFDYLEDTFGFITILRVNENTYLVMNIDLRSQIMDENGQPGIYFIPENATEINAQLVSNLDFSPISDAALLLQGTQRGTVSSASGIFKLPVSKTFNIVEVKHPGVAKRSLVFIKRQGSPSDMLQIELDSRENFLDELMVTATKPDANVSDHRSGIEKMSIKTIRQIPTFLGEIDPIRSITTLPGVSSSGDLGAGYNVRGGENSQNLILQDEALIFNPSHLFGFFSSFNPDVISSVELLKGCGPSSYGGRVASVLDINTRNGDVNSIKAKAGLGLVSSRLSLEGPIKRGRSSILISGRSSYSDWLINQYDDIDLQNSTAKFNDLTGKLFFSIGEEDALSITGYRSYDNFKFSQSASYGWTTENLSAKWHHKFSEKLGADLSVAQSLYNSVEEDPDELFGFINTNKVGVISGSWRFNLEQSEKMKWQWGINAFNYDMSPGVSRPFSERSQAESAEIATQKGLETAAYIESSLDLTPSLGMDLGLRYSMFHRLGPGTIYTLNYAERDGRLPSIQDSIAYNNNEIISRSGGFEPRVSMRLKLAEASSIKAAYTRTQQFIQQVSPTISPSPIDYWVLSSNNLKPQQSNQFSFGVFNNFNENKIETSVEVFYNKTFNALDYLDGVDLKLNPTYEQGLAQGVGEAYGLELFIKKRGGVFNGWIAYTWSRSWRTFNSEFEGQSINNGNRYPSAFDQPHQLSVVTNLQLPRRVEFSSNITYNSGRPITIPISKYSYGGLLSINNYSDRNQYRTPDYMRLDVSLTFNGKEIEGKWYKGDLIFSVYNLLARKNAYAIWFDNTGQAFKTSILATAFPSLTYNISIN